MIAPVVISFDEIAQRVLRDLCDTMPAQPADEMHAIWTPEGLEVVRIPQLAEVTSCEA